METFSELLALCVGNSPVTVNSPNNGQWRGALMFSLICAWINGWVNTREAGDLRRHRTHYDISVMNLGQNTTIPIYAKWILKCRLPNGVTILSQPTRANPAFFLSHIKSYHLNSQNIIKCITSQWIFEFKYLSSRHHSACWWHIVNWTHGNTLQGNLNRNSNIFMQKNVFENFVWEMSAILSRARCVEGIQGVFDPTSSVLSPTLNELQLQPPLCLKASLPGSKIDDKMRLNSLFHWVSMLWYNTFHTWFFRTLNKMYFHIFDIISNPTIAKHWAISTVGFGTKLFFCKYNFKCDWLL